ADSHGSRLRQPQRRRCIGSGPAPFHHWGLRSARGGLLQSSHLLGEAAILAVIPVRGTQGLLDGRARPLQSSRQAHDFRRKIVHLLAKQVALAPLAAPVLRLGPLVDRDINLELAILAIESLETLRQFVTLGRYPGR